MIDPGTFQIIYADPPWSYNDKAAAGKRGASFKYECMTIEQLIAFEVDGVRVPFLAGPDAALFLWATGPMLREALSLMKAWGFEYVNKGFTWAKRTKNGKWHFGMGNYTRANAEDCLLGIRGKMTRVDAGVPMLVEAPVGKHSAKPPEVRDRIVRLFGEDMKRIELFARDRADGWYQDGLELEDE